MFTFLATALREPFFLVLRFFVLGFADRFDLRSGALLYPLLTLLQSNKYLAEACNLALVVRLRCVSNKTGGTIAPNP